jgi:hypothetical protein
MGTWKCALAALALTTGLPGCKNETAGGADAEQANKAIEKLVEQRNDPCEATKVADYLGQEPTATVKEQVAAAAGKRDVRYAAPGTPPAPDQDAKRLNADLDDQGRIAMFWCG